MKPLWEDLERWSKEERGEELGKFTFHRRGGLVHVGIPWSQLVLSEGERANLPCIFCEASIDPDAPPADRVLVAKLRLHGQKLLSARTRRLLAPNNEAEKELLGALIDLVLKELEDWDREEPEQREISPATERITPAPKIAWMYICLEKIDIFSQRVECCLRIKTPQVPEDGFILDHLGETYTCKEAPNQQGWTTKLRWNNNGSSDQFDPAVLDWAKGATFRDHENNWVVSFKGGQIRLFMHRPLEAINGWIECNQLAYNSEFIVACHQDRITELETWGGACALHKVEVSGLPAR